jgi:hypothetical protein
MVLAHARHCEHSAFRLGSAKTALFCRLIDTIEPMVLHSRRCALTLKSLRFSIWLRFAEAWL